MNMKKYKKYSARTRQMMTRLMLTFLMILSFGFGLQAQDTGNDQSKVGQELDQFVGRFLDWVVLSYATYTGQHDAELESIFAKAKEALDKQPEVQEFLQEIQSASSENGLEQIVRDFTNKTGIGVYFVPQIVNNNDGFYVPIFNDFLAEGAKNPIAPYVIVKPVIDGNNKDGYNISYSIETSPDFNPKKYNLDQADGNNPFNAISGQATKRKDLVMKLKPNLAGGVYTLTNTVNENFLPKLVITYEGNVYRPGEEIEVGMETDSTAEIRLIAQNRDGSSPSKTVKWTVTPETVERKVRGSDLLFPKTQAGQWAIMAESGSNKATVGVKVVNFNLDWDEFLRNFLKTIVNESLSSLEAKIDEKLAEQEQLNSEIDDLNINNFSARASFNGTGSGNIGAVGGMELELNQSVSDALKSTISQDETAQKFIQLKTKSLYTARFILKEVKIKEFLNSVIDDPDNAKALVEELKSSYTELIVDFAAKAILGEDIKSELKPTILEFINRKIEEL